MTAPKDLKETRNILDMTQTETKLVACYAEKGHAHCDRTGMWELIEEPKEIDGKMVAVCAKVIDEEEI